MWLFLLTVAIVCFIYFLCYKPYQVWKDRGIPYSKPYPLIGNFLDFVLRKKHITYVINDLYNEFPDKRFSGIFQFTRPSLLIRDLDLIKQIGVKEFDQFPDHKSIITRDQDPLMGSSLISLTGQEWKDMRATLSPAFTSAKMRNMFAFMSECAENLAEHFANKSTDVQSVEMKDVFTRFTNDVIATTAFGIKTDSLEDPKNEFFTMGQRVTQLGFKEIMKGFAINTVPKLTRALKITFFPSHITDFFKHLVYEQVDLRERQHIIRPDLIHLLMQARKGKLTHENAKDEDAGFATVEESQVGKAEKTQKRELTLDDMTAQALLFFFAGFDTASTACCFMAHELAVNVDVQEKLQNEIDQIREASKNGKVSYEDLLRMKYLDQVISESLRKWPPAVHTDRLCVSETVFKPVLPGEKEVILKKGDFLIIPIMPIQRDPKYFPDPEKFDPDRFSDENKTNIKPGSYMPFGIGPRNCIGSRFALLEIKVLFFYLLSKFTLVPVDKTTIPLKLSPKTVILKPENGFWLGLEPRNIDTT